MHLFFAGDLSFCEVVELWLLHLIAAVYGAVIAFEAFWHMHRKRKEDV